MIHFLRVAFVCITRRFRCIDFHNSCVKLRLTVNLRLRLQLVVYLVKFMGRQIYTKSMQIAIYLEWTNYQCTHSVHCTLLSNSTIDSMNQSFLFFFSLSVCLIRNSSNVVRPTTFMPFYYHFVFVYTFSYSFVSIQLIVMNGCMRVRAPTRSFAPI